MVNGPITKQICPYCVLDLEEAGDRRLEELRAQLQRYGGHENWCNRHIFNSGNCNCGWAEIAEGFDKGKGE